MRPTLIAVRTLVSVTCCSVTLSTPKHATARLVVARNSGGPGSQFSRYINWAAICSRAVSKRNISSTSAVAMVDPVVVPALAKQTSTVIMLHGLGDVGSSWVPISEEFSADLPNTKFIFPTAPTRPITVNMGMSMTGWHDIASLEKLDVEEDRTALLESMQYIETLAQQERSNGIQKIVIAGFSQGGTIALLMLRSDMKFAGIVGLSTYLSLRNDTLVSEANKDTPVWLAHGTADEVVKYKFGEMSSQLLTKAGVKTVFGSVKGMGHATTSGEMQDMLGFLKSVLHN